MQVIPTDATIGAIVRDVDLRCLQEETFAAIEAAWHEHAVLVFEAQHLTGDQHLAFSRRFGRLEQGLIKSSGRMLAHLSNVTRNGSIADPESLQVRFGKGNELWHSDSSYKRVGAKASLLAAHAVPDTGGETEWADMRAGYAALDTETRTWLEDKIAVHSYVYSHTWHGGLELLGEDDLANLPPVEHLIVQIHPVTGRKHLFVGRHASHVLGEDIEESRALLRRLTEEACQPPRTFMHRWNEGDLAIWDNRCVLHRGRPWPLDQARDMVRSTIAGDDRDNEWAESAG